MGGIAAPQAQRWEDHPVHFPRPGKLSEVTISGRIQAAKSFFKWCVDRGYLDRSPAAHLRQSRVDHSVMGNGKVMARDDLGRMVASARARMAAGYPLATRNLALLLFIAETGCRIGEAASLRVGRLALGDCEAIVEGKTGKRSVDFTTQTARALLTWLHERLEVDHGFVFVARRGNALTTAGLYNVFRRLAKAAGVEGRFNPHSLRHLVGQLWTDETNLELARQKLGHKDVTTTAQFYAHQDRSRVKAMTKRLSLVNSL